MTPSPWAPWIWPFVTAPESAAQPDACWATPNEVVLELESLRLRRFGDPAASGPATLVVAPYAIHGATVADFAEGHSLMRRLRDAGVPGLHLLEWATATPQMRFHGVDDQLAALNVAVDTLGGTARLAGICQGGWQSLLFAARFPAKVERLVLAGAPVDCDAAPSGIVQATRGMAPAALDAFVAWSDGVVSGSRMLQFLETSSLQSADVEEVFQAARPDLAPAFEAWNARTLDLPGRYWLQTAEWLFRENRLARNTFPALGRLADLRDVRCPLFVLAGRDDVIAPAPQALAAARLVGAPARSVHAVTAPCGHLALFMGARTLADEWGRIAAFLRA
ncbi:alpha/beta fold hydrolase [Alsobacter sp. KACC 23698]|uniref:Alpha/beta fold hydrolase n=1 Tax=Alsobacter sp. KACC 23698 TaxID=3149229 RepID=A0AAU7JG88_9HYPH